MWPLPVHYAFVAIKSWLFIDMENWRLDGADDVAIHLFKIVNCEYSLSV